MFDPSVPFTLKEINLIESSGLTIGELRDFYERFPDQSLEAAIGGCIMEKKALEEGLEPGLEADREINSDVPPPAEFGGDLGEAISEETSE